MNKELEQDFEFWEDIIRHCIYKLKKQDTYRGVNFYTLEIIDAVLKMAEIKKGQLDEKA